MSHSEMMMSREKPYSMMKHHERASPTTFKGSKSAFPMFAENLKVYMTRVDFLEQMMEDKYPFHGREFTKDICPRVDLNKIILMSQSTKFVFESHAMAKKVIREVTSEFS